MLTAKDYHRAATYLLSRYGDDALERAANRASELRESGEAGLQRIWDVLFETLREIDKAGTDKRRATVSVGRR
jgi:hypothetical protein